MSERKYEGQRYDFPSQSDRPHSKRQEAALQRRVARTPEIFRDDEGTLKFILRTFPKSTTDPRQMKRAAIWHQIIRLYWRLYWTPGQIAHELKMEDKQVYDTITRIGRAERGLSTNGKPLKKKGHLKL